MSRQSLRKPGTIDVPLINSRVAGIVGKPSHAFIFGTIDTRAVFIVTTAICTYTFLPYVYISYKLARSITKARACILYPQRRFSAKSERKGKKNIAIRKAKRNACWRHCLSDMQIKWNTLDSRMRRKKLALQVVYILAFDVAQTLFSPLQWEHSRFFRRRPCTSHIYIYVHVTLFKVPGILNSKL